MESLLDFFRLNFRIKAATPFCDLCW